MIRKIKSIEEGLGLLAELDAEIGTQFDLGNLSSKEYKRILLKLNQRKALISQMNIMREQKPLANSPITKKIKEIYRKNQDLLARVAEKQGKILKRLNERQKSVKKNKNFPY